MEFSQVDGSPRRAVATGGKPAPPAPGHEPGRPPDGSAVTATGHAEVTVSGHAEVCAVLADPRFVVPTVPVDDAAPGTVAWLRAGVARFSNGPRHRRRRAMVAADLRRMEPPVLRAAAREWTAAVVEGAGDEPFDVMASIARTVPIGVLGGALGVAGLDPARPDGVGDFVSAVSTVAAAYHPGTGGGAADNGEADAAVSALVALLGPGSPEAVAARIGLLVQACDATAGLIGNTLDAALPPPPAPKRPPGEPGAGDRSADRPVGTEGDGGRGEGPVAAEGDGGRGEGPVAAEAGSRMGERSVESGGGGGGRGGWPVEWLVAETARRDPPVRSTRRVATAGAEIAGRGVPPGTVVLLDLAAAERDPRVFPDPGRFDPARRTTAHLAFGHGPRSCPGSDHGLALACGVLEVLLPRCERAGGGTVHGPSANLRVPLRLEVRAR
ncbi:cytochrome P450 [Sphaerisporangium sp. NPDC005289]|uniref:cytochrome P450 n=1 Tax=Sphaerisporangium sp. NPDC005289 TaxID=3155247 RepID=UPI0033B073F1